jgi:hypothetical protein
LIDHVIVNVFCWLDAKLMAATKEEVSPQSSADKKTT